jgi:serine/threonine protein kinase
LTSEELLKALRAVGILTDDDVRECHQELAAATRLVKSGKLTKFQATQALAGKSKALVMGDYVILDRIGAGGMGQVFKAQHRRMMAVSDLSPLAGCKELTTLKATRTKVTAAGVAALQKALPGCKIEWDGEKK